MPKPPLGLTFDDVLLVPQESNVRPSTVNIETKLTRRLTLKAPLLSAAMDTVTEEAMALAMAEAGGLGVLHRNCSIERQVQMARRVKQKGLMVGAAVGPHDLDRVRALDKVGVDVIVLDAANIHKPSAIADAKKIKKIIKAELIVGNIATPAAARAFLNIADTLKVGVGPGAICTTRIVAGVGVPQLTAIMEVSKIAKLKKIPVIADGGIRYSGDITKAIAAGADTVMLGSLLAGTDEAPGQVVKIKGKKFKRFRGMGSLGAMSVGESTDRYAQHGQKKYVPEGVEALTPYKGPVNEIIFQMLGGLRAGLGYVGAKNLRELQKRGKFVRLTDAGRAESHPHSIIIEKQAPNYAPR